MPDGRVGLVRGKAEQWARELTDFGHRNTLLYHRDTRHYTVDLTAADPALLASLLAGRTARIGRLLPDPAQAERANAAARTLRRRILLMREEQGVEVGRMARGIVGVDPPRGRSAVPQRPLRAPLLLHPVGIEPRTPGENDHVVEITGDVEVNPVLLVALRDHFGVDLDIDTVQRRIDAILESTSPENQLDAAFEELQTALADHAQPAVLDARSVLGAFSFEKLPMVQDLRESAELLAQHDVIAAAAGDPGARADLRRAAAEQHAETDLDQVTPPDEFLVLDADSSQHRAVLAVASGRHVVIEGPPGTGKSQTIANIIAGAAAVGRSVLFVTEKRAAIEAVTDRLATVGLADLVFDLHGQQTRAAVATQISESLDALTTALPPDVEELHRSLSQTRRVLTQRDEALHAPRAPWGPSAYDLQERLLGLPAQVATSITIGRAELRTLDRSATEALAERLATFVRHGGLPVLRGESTWSHADVPTLEAAGELLDRLNFVTGSAWRTAQTSLEALVARAGLRRPPDLASWQYLFTLLAAVERTTDRYGPDVYSGELVADCAAAVSASERQHYASADGWWRRWQRRRAVVRGGARGLCWPVNCSPRWTSGNGGGGSRSIPPPRPSRSSNGVSSRSRRCATTSPRLR